MAYGFSYCTLSWSGSEQRLSWTAWMKQRYARDGWGSRKKHLVSTKQIMIITNDDDDKLNGSR